jgi:hypothetical protein
MADEPLADAVAHLLWAIDGGHFSDPHLSDSAFIRSLREAYTAETGRAAYPRLAAAEQAESSAWPHTRGRP